jgi:vacuolar protein sorting-associated protein 13A/C
LTDDQEYIESREQNYASEKPSHVGEGLLIGFKSAGKSILSGLTGVYEKPIEGARKKGFGGFLTGALKGVSGLITKPVSGTLDLISKTADGIKNTPKALIEDEQEKIKRIRLPRPMFNSDQVIKIYDDALAYIHIRLCESGSIRIHEDYYLNTFQLKELIFMAIYSSKIILYQVKSEENPEEVRLIIHTRFIHKVERESGHKVKIIFMNE